MPGETKNNGHPGFSFYQTCNFFYESHKLETIIFV